MILAMDEKQSLELNHSQTPPKTSLKEQLTTVTSVSRFLAMILFVTLPFIGFWLGIQEAKKEIPGVVYIEKESISDKKNEPKNAFSEEVTPNSGQASEGNLYQNTKFGFSFRYPANYEVVSADRLGDEKGDIIGLSAQTLKDNSYYSVSISEIQATSSDGLKAKLDSVWLPPVSIRKLSIGGFDGVYIDNPNGGIAGESTFYFITPEATLEITPAGTFEESDPVVTSLQKIKTESEVYNETFGI
jgi:hypothetical protein